MINEDYPAISIIIPVFNGEAFLSDTITSLLDQTFQNFEIICVDDSSTDNSLSLLKSFSLKDPRVKVYSKKNEGTAAKAIIYGLNFAKGDYYMYSSQDDLFSKDLLEKNFSKAQTLNADAIVPDMLVYHKGKPTTFSIIGVEGDRNVVLSGREAFVLSLDWTIHGFVLWSMDLVKRVGFFDFSINSDEYTTRMLYFNAAKVAFTDGIFYYSQNNPNAITKKWDIRLLESFHTCDKLEHFIIENNFGPIALRKFYTRIFGELLRIQQIFNANKKAIAKEEAEKIQQTIKIFYLKSKHKIGDIETNNFIAAYKVKVVSANFTLFTIFCRMQKMYHYLRSNK